MPYEVTEADTAMALGSGDVPVLATPRLIAWSQAAVRIEHRRASSVGDRIEIIATTLSSVPG
jgi:fluoroacetyl-CoA thioesterase